MIALFAACGGSGSTGLIRPEGALLAEVRRDGSCIAASGTTFCAVDVRGPDGVRARSGDPVPAPTVRPPGALPTPTPPPNGSGEPTPQATQGGPSPSPSATDGPATIGVRLALEGFFEGAACALAVRSAGSAEVWQTGPLAPVDEAATETLFLLPSPAPGPPLESALVCFNLSPGTLPSRVERLVDTGPDVIFALPDDTFD